MLMQQSNQHKHAKRSGPQAQRGFALWELAILVGLLGLGLAAGFVFLKAGEANQVEAERANLLAVADRSLQSFVAEKGRLPCPDTDGTGVENCAAGVQKGWLPFATLGLDASAPARGVKQLRYVVYRGTTADLATLVDRFNPSRWDNYSSPASGNYFTYSQLSMPDFCQALSLAEGAAISAVNAHVLNSAGAVQNIAYAMSDGGLDLDGNGNVFDGTLNFLVTTPGLESTTRPADAGYDDRVLARGFSDLRNHFHCVQVNRSLDAMAQAVEVVNEVTVQQANNKAAAITLTVVESVKAVLAAVGLGSSIVAMAAAVGALTAASTFLALNTGLCAAIITAPIGCPLVPVGATAVALAIAAIAGAGGAIAGNTAAVALEITAAVKAGIAAGKAGASPPGGAPLSLADMVALLLKAYNDAVTKAATDLAGYNTARAAADAALVAYNTSVANLFTVAHVYDTAGTNDAALVNVLNLYKSYKTSLDIYYVASGKVNRLQTMATAAATAATDAATAAAIAAAITPLTPTNIIATTKATLDASTAAETTAKAAAAADPTNGAKVTASSNATVAVINASIDYDLAKRTAAAVAPARNYVQIKQDKAAQLLLDSTAAATELANAQTDAATKNTDQGNKKAAYEGAAAAAAGSAAYNPSGFTYGPAVLSAIEATSVAYDTYVGKEQEAVQLKVASDGSAQNVIKALAGYNSLLAVVTGATGTAPGIILTSGTDAILKQADLIGAIK